MLRSQVRRVVRVAVLATVFGVGYLCGSVTERPADAQMEKLGDAVMKQAGEAGGTVGTVAKLGTTITDMEEQVDGLQKNLALLKQIQGALGG